MSGAVELLAPATFRTSLWLPQNGQIPPETPHISCTDSSRGSPLEIMQTNRLCSSCMQLQCSPIQPSEIFLTTCHTFSPGWQSHIYSMDKPGCKHGKGSSHADSDGAFAWNFCGVGTTRVFCCIWLTDISLITDLNTTKTWCCFHTLPHQLSPDRDHL